MMTFQIKFYLINKIQLMEREQHELEYARKRLKQKKRVVSSFCASIFSQFIFVCLH
jgi:hypothetical protein